MPGNIIRLLKHDEFSGGSGLATGELVEYLNQLKEVVDLINNLGGAAGAGSGARMNYVSPSSVEICACTGESSITLEGSDGKMRSLACPSTIDLAVSGLGGLETGSPPEAADTWYYTYVVPDPADPDDDTWLPVFSPNAPVVAEGPGPLTTPFAYLAGAVRNDGSSNIIPFVKIGNRFELYHDQLVESLSSPPSDPSPVPISLVDFIPQTSCGAFLLSHVASLPGGGGTVGLFVKGFTTGTPKRTLIVSDAVSDQVDSFMPTPTAVKEYYRQVLVTSAIDEVVVSCSGWIDGLLQ